MWTAGPAGSPQCLLKRQSAESRLKGNTVLITVFRQNVLVDPAQDAYNASQYFVYLLLLFTLLDSCDFTLNMPW